MESHGLYSHSIVQFHVCKIHLCYCLLEYFISFRRCALWEYTTVYLSKLSLINT